MKDRGVGSNRYNAEFFASLSIEPSVNSMPPVYTELIEVSSNTLRDSAEKAVPGRSDTCARCGGLMPWLEAATTQQSAARLLARLGRAPQPPPAPSRAPVGQLSLPLRN